jgi:type IV pilus assembly protein PilW
MRTHPTLSRISSRGFTLVELMVGVTVALIGLLVIAGVLDNANRQKRTTASGADAQTSGAIASHMIETDVRMAGYATNFSDLLGCEIYGYDEGTTPARSFVFTISPAAIVPGTPNAYGTPDNLTITYGASDVGFSAPQLTQANNGSNANYKVNNRFGFHEGDLIIAVEPVDRYTPNATTFAPTLGANGLFDCVLGQVTGVPGTPGQSDNIIHNSGNYTNAVGDNVPARYNKPSGMGISLTTSAKIFNMGPMPINVTYAVTTDSQLTRLNSFSDTAPLSVAENIVMLRARYGKDTNGDGNIDTWDQTTPTSAALWQQVIAINFAVVARSHARETGMVTGASLQLWPSATMPGGAVIAGPTLPLTDEQRHYRYKVFHSLVPLRNMIWGTS